MEDWHGVGFWLFPGLLLEAVVEVSSDAAGKFGYGAYIKGSLVSWLLGSFPAAAIYHLQGALSLKRSFFLFLCVWGHLWVKKHILFRSDKEAVVHILNTQTSRLPCLMHLLRSLLFSAAHHSFSFSSQQVPVINNQLADALSRFNWQEFWHLAPDAQPRSTVVPPDLLALLTSPP